MARLEPQVMLQLARRLVQHEFKGMLTAWHAPEIPDGASSDDPGASLAPLDVRLLQTIGFRAYLDPATGQSAWPVPLGLSPDELAMFGEEHAILHEEPQRGDIFLQRSFREKEFLHAGLVMTVDDSGLLDDRIFYYRVSTVEGDTDHRGLPKRGYTCKLRRRLSPTQGDRFLRWADFDAAVPARAEVR